MNLLALFVSLGVCTIQGMFAAAVPDVSPEPAAAPLNGEEGVQSDHYSGDFGDKSNKTASSDGSSGNDDSSSFLNSESESYGL